MNRIATYPIDVSWSVEDASWVANVPDLEHCSAIGVTPHDAVAEVEVAIEAWLEAAVDAGIAIPQPTVRSSSA